MVNGSLMARSTVLEMGLVTSGARLAMVIGSSPERKTSLHGTLSLFTAVFVTAARITKPGSCVRSVPSRFRSVK